MTTTLLVVAQNEIAGMRAIMPKVDPRWCEQILVVDGRSTDGTAEYARAMGYDVHVQGEPGLFTRISSASIRSRKSAKRRGRPYDCDGRQYCDVNRHPGNRGAYRPQRETIEVVGRRHILNRVDRLRQRDEKPGQINHREIQQVHEGRSTASASP